MAFRSPRPTTLLLAATVVSGGSGYIANALVPAVAGVEDYTRFAVLWSAIFFVVGALGGLQQEVTRASAAPSDPRGSRAAPFAIVVAIVVAAVTGLLAAVGFPALDIASDGGPVVATMLAVAGYAVVAVVCGRLYGVSAFLLLAIVIALDGVLRLIAVGVALALGGGITALAWAISIPFPLALLVVFPLLRRRLLGVAPLDVPPRTLAWNAARLVAAAAAMALLVSGMPTVLRVAFPHAGADELAPLALALSLVRAPLLIPVLALQSLLIVRFGRSGRRAVLLLAGAIAGGGAVLAIGAAFIGPLVLDAVYGPPFGSDPVGLGLVVASSGVLGALIVVTAALVAHGKHVATLLAWWGAVAATLVIALVDLTLPVGVHAGVAMIGGAVAGLAVAIPVLVRGRVP